MSFKRLPFYYKSHASPNNSGKPHTLPFNIVYDKKLEMFRQISNPELNQILQEVYDEGRLVDGSISSESGEHYVPKILAYISNRSL